MDVVDKVTLKGRKGVTGWAVTGQAACVRGRKEGLCTVTSQQLYSEIKERLGVGKGGRQETKVG